VVSARRLADTNLIARYIVRDHAEHTAAAEKLFEASDRGDVIIVVLPSVFTESVFVMQSYYRRSREQIALTLKVLLTSPGIEFEPLAIHLDALDRYRTTNEHIVDCVIAATAAAEKIPVATFDRGFQKFPDVKVQL
jgi:predicted nucleic acid-binding protein